MEPDNVLRPTEALWRAVEELNDALSGDTDLQKALETGLGILLDSAPEVLAAPGILAAPEVPAESQELADSNVSPEPIPGGKNRIGAALFLPRFCEHVTRDWTVCGLPDAWESQLNGRMPRVGLRSIVDQVMTSGAIIPAQPDLGLGAAFPVSVGGRVFGVLLVCGPAVAETDYPTWLAMLRPFVRVVALHARLSGNTLGIPSYLELMRSRNTLRAMFDSLPISIYIIDPAYNLLAINHSRSDRVGEKPPQLVGRKCYEKLYHRSSPCQGCRVGETFSTSQSTMRLSRDWMADDKFVEWEISTFPILEEATTGGEHKEVVAQTILIEQDVTDKRNLEANLIQSEKLAAVGQLAAGIAHEINNPLTAIIANAQILRHEVPPGEEDMLDSIKLIEMAGTRASQVVRNLLGIARKEKYEFEPIDLNETLHNAISLVQHELIGRPIEVQLSLAEHLPRVLASQDQLQGVWINLILNAIDAIDKDNGQISVSSRYTGSEFHVVIMDNGKGIALDHLPRVFEPFFTTKSPGRGTGLGLSVCMRVIRHHGGDIHVDSQISKWTKFTVILPGPKL